MKYRHTSVLATALCVLCALSITVAQAQTPTPTPGLTLKTREGVQMGAQVSSYGYQEFVDNAQFIDVRGSKLGITANYTATLQGDGFVSLDFRHAFGQVQYTGSGNASGADHLTDLRLTGGADFSMAGYTLSPYAGLGHRALHNDLAGFSTTGASGYRRDSTYLYLPLGIAHRFAVPNGRVVTTFEYDHLIQGTQVSHLGDFGGPGDLSNLQRNGRGLRLGLAYETRHWTSGVFFQTWEIQDSDLATAVGVGGAMVGLEPQNTTREFGIDVKYMF